MSDAVWITGAGCVCAAGADSAAAMSGLYAGLRPQTFPQALSGTLPDFSTAWQSGPKHPTNPVCAIPEVWLEPGWRKGSTRDSSRLLLKAAGEALETAGLAELPPRAGICAGTTAGCALHFLEDYRRIRETPDQQSACPAIEDFYALSMAFDLAGLLKPESQCGPLLTISNACTSGADAIGMAAEWIRQGRCEVALAGGTDALSVVPYIGFNRLMIYSAQPCRPFDKQRSGLNLGEGAGVLVLESAAHARKRGAVPLGLLKGWGAATDAHHLTAPHPQGRGLRAAISKALIQAGVQAGDIAFINAHGTSTPENDRIESAVYAELFPKTRLWASKGVTGHCLGGAGALEAVFTLRALNAGQIPASAGCSDPEEAVVNMLTMETTVTRGNLAMSVSLGFGGSNAALVFSRP